MPESGEPEGPVSALAGRGSGASDLELARRALAGVGEARRELDRRLVCVPRMLNHLNARWGRPLQAHDVEDLSQDVLVALWRSLPSYAGLSALESWIFRCCHRALAARLRRMPPLGSTQGSKVLEPAAGEGPEVHEDVYQALETLEPRARQVVELKHFEERTFEEIGAVLERSPNTVKTWYYQALEELRRALGRSRGSDEA
ncbi:MAG TPA: sigma-70 family RNA polymerase sigma factor [Planctomycetota bacterium]